MKTIFLLTILFTYSAFAKNVDPCIEFGSGQEKNNSWYLNLNSSVLTKAQIIDVIKTLSNSPFAINQAMGVAGLNGTEAEMISILFHLDHYTYEDLTGENKADRKEARILKETNLKKLLALPEVTIQCELRA